MSMNTRHRKVLKAIEASELPRALLARDSGLSRSTLEFWQAGRRTPSEDAIAKLAQGLRRRATELAKIADQLERERA